MPPAPRRRAHSGARAGRSGLLRHGRVYRMGSPRPGHVTCIRKQRFATPRLQNLVVHHLVVCEARLAQRARLDAAIGERKSRMATPSRDQLPAGPTIRSERISMQRGYDDAVRAVRSWPSLSVR